MAGTLSFPCNPCHCSLACALALSLTHTHIYTGPRPTVLAPKLVFPEQNIYYVVALLTEDPLKHRALCTTPSPSLLLIGAQVGESPPRAYVRVRAVRAHLAFELRRFWLAFTSLPAFSARCCARRGSSGKATGGGEGSHGRRHRREEDPRRRRWRGREGGASCPRQQITWPLNPRDSRTWAPASGTDSPPASHPLPRPF